MVREKKNDDQYGEIYSSKDLKWIGRLNQRIMNIISVEKIDIGASLIVNEVYYD